MKEKQNKTNPNHPCSPGQEKRRQEGYRKSHMWWHMPVILGGKRSRTTKRPRTTPPSGDTWHFTLLEMDTRDRPAVHGTMSYDLEFMLTLTRGVLVRYMCLQKMPFLGRVSGGKVQSQWVRCSVIITNQKALLPSSILSGLGSAYVVVLLGDTKRQHTSGAACAAQSGRRREHRSFRSPSGIGF